ncbi:unnamed protein product [Haemonchus placei]|uniref:glucuronosyltransferase n=1 Tax=Haemonchus placei TaxID=6290 RepID=A0A158QLT0_HAEPC|nr:unnamed protein product [Haemonchus placei]
MAKEKFDLILTDTLFAACAYGFTTLNQWIAYVFFFRNFVLTPRHFMPVDDAEFKPAFFSYRLASTLEWIGNFIISGIIVGERIKMALAPAVPSFSFFEYHRTASAALTDMPTDLLGPFPRTNDVSDRSTCLAVEISPCQHLGTVINWGRTPKSKFKAVLETLNSLTDYRIVWAYNGKKMKMKPHIYASSWIPQVDVLFNNRTVLFFSHGGLKSNLANPNMLLDDENEINAISCSYNFSVKEATCSSVPSIFMPMFAEQVRNGWMAKNKGYAEVFSKHNLTTENLTAAMKRVLENRRFNSNAARMTTFFNDKVVHPLEHGVHFVNRLLKYGGRMPEFFYPRGRSHTGSFMALINKLKNDGHQVFLYMEAYPDEMNFGLEDRILRIKNHSNPFADDKFQTFLWQDDYGVTDQRLPFFYGAGSCETVLKEHRDFFDEMVKEKFDLILTDTLFAACAYGIATLNQAHHVLMSSTHIESATGSMRAHGINFVLTPRHFMPVDDTEFKPSFFLYRLASTLEWIENFVINGIIVGERMKIALAPVVPSFRASFTVAQSTTSNRMLNESVFIPFFLCFEVHFRVLSFFEYHKTASATLTDMPTDLIGPFPRTNDLLDYGAYCPTPKRLTGELLEFVSDPKSKGTILVAFGRNFLRTEKNRISMNKIPSLQKNYHKNTGTVINWGQIPKTQFEAVLETLSSLTDYRIVWSYNGKEMKMKPHIYALKWIPQVDVLFDNRTVLFFSHGGLKSYDFSVKEATCSSVPSIFMPMFAEQVRNGWMTKNKVSRHGCALIERSEISRGYGEVFSKHNLTTENLTAVMKRVLENKRFTSNAARMTMLFNDKVIHPLEQGVHYVNRLLKYGGRMPEFFYPRAITRDYLSYLNLDIFVIPLITVIGISY